jgi:predicted RNase H-like HicB family nuclease
MKYLVVIEQTATGFSAYSPDLPGCIATGGTVEEVQGNMRDAMEFHLEGLAEAGQAAPPPTAQAVTLELAV